MKGQKTGHFLLIALVLVLWAAYPVQALGVTLSVKAIDYVHPGEEFDAQVILKDPSAIQALDFSLQFDASKLEIIRLNGKYIQSGEALTNAWVIYPQGGLENGNTVNLAVGWTINGGLTYTGEKVLGTIRFKSISEGKSDLKISVNGMENNNGVKVIPVVQNDVVYVDETGPVIELNNFPDGTVTNNQFPVLSVKAVDDVSGVDAIKINDLPALSDGKGNWSVPLTLAEGKNNIIISAQDRGGNVSEKKIKVILDQKVLPFSLDPLVSVTRGKTTRSIITIWGRVESGATVKVNGIDAKLMVGSKTRWYARIILKTGINKISVTAKDRAGNSAVKMLEITREKKGLFSKADRGGWTERINSLS
ncbi:MAG: cohesin domain-containing protein [Bacillota bacterium]|jgi:hypothetical protein